MLKLKLKAPEPEPEEVPKISLSLGNTPKIKVKTKAAIEGYDSEAPDKEDDPTIEEAVVLRMLPGAGLEKLSTMCESNNYDNLSVKFEDARRAVINVDGTLYAAQLLDLPTITEVQKTFDRKNIYKSLDIAQILLVVKEISSESELTTAIPTTQQYQHGIAPPLHNVRNRRFQQRVSNKLIEAIESKVDDLFKKDQAAQDVTYELLPASAIEQTPGVIVSDMVEVQGPADDEEEEEEEDFDMAMELEKALEEDKDDDDDDDDDDSDDDDDDEDADPNDARNHNKLLKEEIHELQVTINAKERESEATVNQIMKGRLIDVVNRMKNELVMKTNMLKDAEDAQRETNDIQVDEDEPEEEEEEKKEENEAPAEEKQASSETAAPTPASEPASEPILQPGLEANLEAVENSTMAVDEEEDDLDALF